MPASTVKRAEINWEANMAAVALAGVRPLANSTVTVNAAAAADYTVTHVSTMRLVVFHNSAGNTDIRADLNSSPAEATDFPIMGGVYFVFEVETGDVLNLYNTTGGSVSVYVLEIR